jgi:lipopolysaccharide transport system ATP-binding protein
MSETVIEVNNISKQYRLGIVGRTSMSEDIKRYWAKLRGKADPTIRIGQSNVISQKVRRGEDEYIWALKDINFEVKQGEVLGVIGKNGAGKSTLLKILSKVTSPTLGEIKVKGRTASLLEIGTGFSPELTGRENIFLNGAILGMTKAEIRGKFDEIVDFSGVERYIDTPVKRYSSGMYVRLAFAVAAHLDPEILIFDEVLAVGDTDFQKKCLGKMQDVSQQEGRTVIFVSHNLTAVLNLCGRTILLQDGKLFLNGATNEVINKYCDTREKNNGVRVWETPEIAPGSEYVKLHSVMLTSNEVITDEIDMQDDFIVEIKYWNFRPNIKLIVCLAITDSMGTILFTSCNFDSTNLEKDIWCNQSYPKGLYKTRCKINGKLLNVGSYSMIVTVQSQIIYHEVYKEDILTFNIVDRKIICPEDPRKFPGFFRPKLKWDTEKMDNN